MYAIVETGGKQYKVTQGDVIRVELLHAEPGDEIELNKVLAVSSEQGLKTGSPYVEGAKVKAKVLAHGKGKKIIVFKYKPKKDYRKKQGHRQPYTKIEITGIEA